MSELMASRTWEHGKGRYHLVGDGLHNGTDHWAELKWPGRYRKPLCGSPCTLDSQNNDPIPADKVPAADRCTRCVKLGWPGDAPDARPGELIVAILAEQGYQLRDDDTSHGRVGFVTHRYGKGHWQLVDFEDEAGYAKWVWDSDDHELINVELPEAWF